MDYRARIYGRYSCAARRRGYGNEFPERWDKWYAWYYGRLLPARKDAAILDAACGEGLFLRFLSRQGFSNMREVDISPEQVTLASRISENVTCGDVSEYLRVFKDEFDLIAGLDIIEHLTKEEVLGFLEACAGALRPGGRLILQTPNPDSPWGGSMRYGDLTHEVALSPMCLARLMEFCGFSEVELYETGPVPHGLISGVRFLLWRCIRMLLLLYDYVERGEPTSGVFTRVFIAAGVVTKEQRLTS